MSQGSIWVVPVEGGQPKKLTDGAAGPGEIIKRGRVTFFDMRRN